MPRPTTSVTIRVELFVNGWLPSVCVVSGEPATEFVEAVATVPGLALARVLVGGALGSILPSGTSKVRGRLPIAPEAARRGTAFARLRSPGPRVAPTFDRIDGVVTLRRVHPAFAAAVKAGVPPRVAIAAGWYGDPSGAATHRYWDGSAWTDHLA